MSVTYNSKFNRWDVSLTLQKVRYRPNFKSKEEAEDWEYDAKKQFKRYGKRPKLFATKAIAGSKKTLQDLLDLTSLHVWSGMKSESDAIANGLDMITLIGKTKLIIEMTKSDVGKAEEALRERGNKESTINRKRAALSRMMTYAYENGLTLERFVVKQKPEGGRRERYLTDEELSLIYNKFIELGFEVEAQFVMFQYYTGFRYSESLRLEWGVNLTDDSKTVYKLQRKRMDSWGGPLQEAAVSILKARQETGVSTPWKCLCYTTFHQRWTRVKADVGLRHDNEVVPHSLRHKFITDLSVVGIHPTHGMRLSGHTNMKTYLSYTHLQHQHLQESMDALNSRSEFGQTTE